MVEMEFTGSFSFLFIFQIPIINYMKWKDPSTKIHMTGLVGEDYYYKNEYGLPILDGYTGVVPDPNVRRPADQYLDFFRKTPRRYVRAGLYAEQPDDDGDFVIFCSRYHKAYEHLDPNGDRHANSDYECDREYLKLLSKDVKVYITGLPGECYEFEDIDNVESIVNIPLENKPRVLLGLTNKALAVISTAASAVATYGMCVGAPTMCFNTHRYQRLYGASDGSNRDTALNPFGTYNHCYDSIKPDATYRHAETLRFLDSASREKRFLRDVFNEDSGDLGWRWR